MCVCARVHVLVRTKNGNGNEIKSVIIITRIYNTIYYKIKKGIILNNTLV